MADQHAAAVYQYLGLPVPKREKIAKVYIKASDIQPGVFEGFADKLAATVVTAAMAQGVTRIELHFPNRQAVYIDADAIKRSLAAEMGGWPSAPEPYMAQAAAINLARLGARFEPWAPMVTVPAQIGPAPEVLPGVSVTDAAPKED